MWFELRVTFTVKCDYLRLREFFSVMSVFLLVFVWRSILADEQTGNISSDNTADISSTAACGGASPTTSDHPAGTNWISFIQEASCVSSVTDLACHSSLCVSGFSIIHELLDHLFWLGGLKVMSKHLGLHPQKRSCRRRRRIVTQQVWSTELCLCVCLRCSHFVFLFIRWEDQRRSSCKTWWSWDHLNVFIRFTSCWFSSCPPFRWSVCPPRWL